MSTMRTSDRARSQAGLALLSSGGLESAHQLRTGPMSASTSLPPVRQGYVARVTAIAALGGLLFGYDTAVINGAIGFLEAHFALDATMKGWAASSALAGCTLGVALAGWMNDRWGRRTTLLVAGALFLISSLGTALPQTFG